MDRTTFLCATAGLFAAATLPVAAQTPSEKRSLWIWQTPLSQSAGIVAFAAANDFGTLFLSVAKEDRSALEAGDASAAAALRSLRATGRTLYLTAGDPAWVEKSRSEVPTTIRKLLERNRDKSLFDGLALDIEPHTLPDWKDGSNKDTLAHNYIALLALIRSKAAAQGVPVLATVHPTYAKYNPPGAYAASLLQRAAGAVDSTDLMAYRNAEATLESFGGEAMQQLGALGKPWWLGVSTHTNSPAGTSYASLPAKSFFPSIDQTAADLAKRYGTSFAGIAVEDYRNTRTLLG
jgi:hypothetical protein